LARKARYPKSRRHLVRRSPAPQQALRRGVHELEAALGNADHLAGLHAGILVANDDARGRRANSASKNLP
jgi:hypothetical protein